ncbi:hypothetical protein [Peteryoungia algae]|uniref:Uncharacterized protein n=1 Tax=Peteryoungia algae TaxID=2919917 RepID=A0ABT0CX91_9HYPH|nr:hypothetical protein [Rhizobium sp. SSM4.3]MCJ8237776.1 hypothetical protein [Rhizobium sp. SSM4.3]
MSTQHYYYTYLSDEGPVSLIPEGGGRYKIVFQNETVGTFASLDDAFVAAITGGLRKLDLPANIAEWQKKLFASVSRLRRAP